MLVFIKYFYKNKKLKLYLRDCAAVLNDFIYQIGRSIVISCSPLAPTELDPQETQTNFVSRELGCGCSFAPKFNYSPKCLRSHCKISQKVGLKLTS
jgi:hypothetical protein